MRIPIQELGFDFDAVIADTPEAFIRLACKEHGYCDFSIQDIIRFEIENCVNVPQEVVEDIFKNILTDSLATGIQPMEGAIQTIERFTRKSQVVIITARSLPQPVYDWLEHYLPKQAVANIKVVTTGDHDDKVQYIRQYGLKYFVDDRAETCNKLALENITPIVYAQPWNQGKHQLQTVANWQEIRKLVSLEE